MSHAGKNVYNAGKTSGVLSGGASGANRCYVLGQFGGWGLFEVIEENLPFKIQNSL